MAASHAPLLLLLLSCLPGIPLSIIVKDFGWGAYFSTLVAACGLALVLLWPMRNLPSHVQRVARRQARLAANKEA